MANKSNLVPISSTERARELGSKGGKISQQRAKERKTLREELLLLLKENNNQSNMTIALIKKAIDGDTKAFEIVRDTIGEKPTEKQEIDANLNTTIRVELIDE